MQAVSAVPGFVGEHETGRLGVQPADQLVEIRLARSNRADEDWGLGRSARCVGYRDGTLVDVQTDKNRSSLFPG